MAQITAKLVKELRDKTGAGMMDCKAALNETGGDVEQAIDWLRTKGLAKAAKKAGRVAAEGLVGVKAEGTRGVVVEVNSETDFVARNEQFQDMVTQIVGAAFDAGGDLADLGEQKFPGSDKSITEYVKEMVGTIGENMNVRRQRSIDVSDGVVASYIHNAVADNLGKIGVLVGLQSTGDKSKLSELGRKIAMHVAAVNPLALDETGLDSELVERERNILIEEAKESGKPDNIIEKMIEGRMKKFLKESVLLSQIFVMDGETSIADVLKQAEADVGASVAITEFIRFELGDGIEKEDDDFAAEVAAAVAN